MGKGKGKGGMGVCAWTGIGRGERKGRGIALHYGLNASIIRRLFFFRPLLLSRACIRKIRKIKTRWICYDGIGTCYGL